MRSFKVKFYYQQSRARILFSVICFAVFLLLSASSAQSTARNDVDQFKLLQKKLIKDGFNSGKIKKLYSRPQVFFETDGVTRLFTYSEAKLDYDQFSNDWSIDKAKKYMEEYKEDLERIEKAYGVDGRIITAILLVESAFGSSVGTRSTLNTLSTIASLEDAEVRSVFWEMIPEEKRSPRKKFENQARRRSAWAYKELKAFLKYAYRQKLDPAGIPGSFAGAMGISQFMPSSVLAYGKDGNNDGTIDLNTHADSMASIANYLKSHGWRPGISAEKAEKIIYHYNHSKYYVKAILKIAERLQN
jgi:membrane-bound lytic murein transglycosylase B